MEMGTSPYVDINENENGTENENIQTSLSDEIDMASYGTNNETNNETNNWTDDRTSSITVNEISNETNSIKKEQERAWKREQKKEQEKELDQLKEMYKDRKKILDSIISMYKYIFTDEKKQIWEKTAKDVQDDIMSAKYNLDLDRIVKESYAEILNAEQAATLFNKKLGMIPALLDFCYVYYVTHFSEDAPFYKLTETKIKYRLIINRLHAYGNETYNKINDIFEKILDSQLLREMRVESPPFHLMTDLSIKELKEKMEMEIKPILKDLLNNLLLLKKPEKNDMITIKLINECADGHNDGYKETIAFPSDIV